MGESLVSRRGGKLPVPSIFGDGKDGILHISANQTVTLPVPVPHQSVVERNYKSILIEAGGKLTTSDCNAGLILRCQGNCTILGTIDQSCKGPKTNPNNNYQYPTQLICGAGGIGGQSYTSYYDDGTEAVGQRGGNPMPARKYGGGYGGGGSGGAYGMNSCSGGQGGDSDLIVITTPTESLFMGGAGMPQSNQGRMGIYGGGGGAGCGQKGSTYGCGDGGSSSGGDAVYATSGKIRIGAGGAGACGGGIVVIYAAGDVTISGGILCNGGDGGKGYHNRNTDTSSNFAGGSSGGGGGGGGGGGIFIGYHTTFTNTGILNVNGGIGGSGGIRNTTSTDAKAGQDGANGEAGKWVALKL